MSTRFATVACLLLVGCAGATPPLRSDAGASGAVIASARPGETIRVSGLRLTPLRVHEDSRCPADATCVQAGTLRLEVWLESETVTTPRVLILDQGSWFAGRRIELVAGCPYPLASRPAPPSERRFVFAIGTEEPREPADPPDYCA